MQSKCNNDLKRVPSPYRSLNEKLEAEILYAPEMNLQITQSRPGEDFQSAAESHLDRFYL